MKWDEYVDIFDTDVVSKIIILRNLPINEGWIDINELAEELQLNKKSVKKYVELLKDDITYYAVDNDASLAFEKGHGYRLNLASSQAFQKLYTAIFRDSLTYQVMEDLFWGRFNGIVPATAKYHTSDATIRRLLKGFTEILAPLGLVINKSTWKIEGNEAYLRHFAYTIFMDLIRDTWPFDYIQETEVAQTVQKMMAFFNVEVAETVIRRVKYMVAISKVRSAQGAEYRPSAEQETYLEGNKHYQAFIEEMTATTLFLNKNDLTFVYFFLLANAQFYQDEATAQAILAHFDESEAPVYMLTHLVQHFLLEEIHMTPQLEKIRPQIFYYLFATHLFAELYYVQNVKMYNVFWNKIKEKYPVLLAELIQGLNQLYEQTGNELFTNKEFLALRYSSVLALSNDLIHREQKIVLGLKSGLPVLEEERVKLSIENNFRRFYALEVLRYSEASKEEWQNIDLLLVTSLADVETGHPEIFLLSSELTFEQYNRLNQKIVKINEKRTTSL